MSRELGTVVLPVHVAAPSAAGSTGEVRHYNGVPYVYSGTAWVPLSGATPSTTRVVASAQLTLTTANQDVAGLTYTVPAGTGTAIITAAIDFTVSAAGAGTLVAELLVAGVAQTAQVLMGEASIRGTQFQQWSIPKTSSSQIVKIQGRKTINAGTAVIQATHSTMTVLELSLDQKGVLGKAEITSAVTGSAVGGVYTTAITLPTITYVSGRQYQFSAHFKSQAGQAAQQVSHRFMDGATLLGSHEVTHSVTGGAGQMSVGGPIAMSNSLSGAKAITLTFGSILPNSGAVGAPVFQIDAAGKAWAVVEDLGVF